MVLNRLHTKRINESRIIDRQHQGEIVNLNLAVPALKTYRKRPASYLCRRTGMPRAKAGSPCVSRMPFFLVSESSPEIIPVNYAKG
jgi:hypothetical protein